VTRKLTEEKRHIRAQGERFTAALARATMSVRGNTKLTGANLIRAHIAMQAALAATGFPVETFAIPTDAGFPLQEAQEIAEAAYAAATEAAGRD